MGGDKAERSREESESVVVGISFVSGEVEEVETRLGVEGEAEGVLLLGALCGERGVETWGLWELSGRAE